jgi:hypothetical protein
VNLANVFKVVSLAAQFIPIIERAFGGKGRGAEKREGVTECVVAATEDDPDLHDLLDDQVGRDAIGALIDALVANEKILR